MTRTEYKTYIASDSWKRRRKQFLHPYSWCRNCSMPRWLARVVYDQDLSVHHRSYEHLGKEEFRDVELLCRRCLEIETFGRSDLQAPESHRCPTCERRNWNPYSDDCEECHWRKLGLNLDSDTLLLTPVPGGHFVWHAVLQSVCDVVGVEAAIGYANEYRSQPFYRRLRHGD